MILPKVLMSLNIKSRNDFDEAALSGNLEPFVMQREPFKIPEDEIEISYHIFMQNEWIVDVKHHLSLRNCIFVCPVILKIQSFKPEVRIEIDNCIFLDTFSVVGTGKSKFESLSLYHSNIANLSLISINCNHLLISACRIFYASLHGSKSLFFEAESDYFNHFELEECEFEKVDFDHQQIDVLGITKRMNYLTRKLQIKGYEDLILDMNLFEFIPFKTFEDIKQVEAMKGILSTIQFLKKSTSLVNNRGHYMHYLFYEVLLAQDRWHHRVFIWLVGGFLKPHRFLEIAIGVLFIFAFFYTLPGITFMTIDASAQHTLSISEALYFSGITFTTIGFGDIAPRGFARILTITEGLLGITVMSGFLVALVKKYLD